jgi:tetratricopeptide (TPR) repeat protein
MKQLVKIFIILAAALYIVLSLLGGKGEYAAEREIWSINKNYIQISRDPKIIPDVTFDKAIKQFNNFLKHHPKSKLNPMAHILIGRLHALKKDYKTSRNKFEEITQIYKDTPNISVRAVSEIGRTYINESDWANLVRTQERIIKEYPLTDIGLVSPILLARFQNEKNGILAGDKSYDFAIEHYQQIAAQNSGTEFELKALRYKAMCLMVRKRWRESVLTLGSVLNKFSDKGMIDIRTADDLIKAINTVSVTHLNDIELPISIYQEFINSHPNNPINKFFEEIIRSLRMFKQQPVN